jgi:DivIVA domain-containing protein
MFKKPPTGKRGYDEDEVDVFLDVIVTGLREGKLALSPSDVHNVVFKKPPIGKRGYDEDAVDDFLDEVENALTELRAQAQTPQVAKAGWYQDPEEARRFRWWTGTQWTTDTMPRRDLP